MNDLRSRHHALLLSLFSTFALSSAWASQPNITPCQAWQLKNDTALQCNVITNSQSTTISNSSATSSSNLAVDQAMIALADDVTVLAKPDKPTADIKVELRQSMPVAVKTKIKSQTAASSSKVAYRKPITTAAVYKTPPAKPKLSATQIVKNELGREKAALKAAENRLQLARKSGKNASQLEKQVADRRASISAMQSELSRL